MSHMEAWNIYHLSLCNFQQNDPLPSCVHDHRIWQQILIHCMKRWQGNKNMEKKPSENMVKLQTIAMFLTTQISAQTWYYKMTAKLKGSSTMAYFGWHGNVCHVIKECINLLCSFFYVSFLSSSTYWWCYLLCKTTEGQAFMYCQHGPNNDMWLALVQLGICQNQKAKRIKGIEETRK